MSVTNSGCHDNRMDKMWWNEQWMGWPIGPQYAASSNVDNAYKLQGKVLIVIGEMDTNVDPASSLQVVNALVKAHKHFDHALHSRPEPRRRHFWAMSTIAMTTLSTICLASSRPIGTRSLCRPTLKKIEGTRVL